MNNKRIIVLDTVLRENCLTRKQEVILQDLRLVKSSFRCDTEEQAQGRKLVGMKQS